MTGGRDTAHGTAAGAAGRPGWARELLEHLRPAGRDVRRVVDWLAGAVDAEVALRDGAGDLLAGGPLALDEALAADVASGRIASAAWDGDGRHLRLVRIGHPKGARVLAVSRRTPFDRHASDVVTHTAQVIELLLTAHETQAAGVRLRRATADLRLAILQLLMVEDTVSARRVAAGLWPGLLDAETACVYVLESDPSVRDRLAAECIERTQEGALVVRCPAVDGHVIVLSPREATATDLRSLVERHPDTFVGGSVRQSLARTATAYGQAVSALAVARFRPDNTAVYAERTHPERLMDPSPLRTWAARVLRPLDALPHHTRAELLATTRLGLEFTAVATAKILGVSRNTVRARMDRVESMLGVDFDDVTVRAVVHLALHTQINLLDGQGPADSAASSARRLTELLSGPAVSSWARELLDRLDTDPRNVRRTLRTWIAEGANAERAAQALGMHAQTVREHVRSAEPVLERQLLAAGTDLYEVALAHLAVGDLEQPRFARE
ncbi:helix-turn-helix domain-containing protein [Streptomyces althioticus]|uniref:helix-turn-helix domain-containing protein n=1 Tax=Streptomyces althioticus TaxID=83380 RepID=UPI00368AD08E